MAEKYMPTVALTHWATNRYPACVSFSTHCREKTGSIGPSIVITTPVRTKSTWTNAVPLMEEDFGAEFRASEGISRCLLFCGTNAFDYRGRKLVRAVSWVIMHRYSRSEHEIGDWARD